MNSERAIKVFEILIFQCGFKCDELDALKFLHNTSTRPNDEYRFQGDLGFGGKLYTENGKFRVDCYPEDLTPKRAEIIRLANQKLSEI